MDGTPLTEASGQSRGWDNVRIEVENVVARSTDAFNPDTLANVRDLLTFCRKESPAPASVEKGYWNTIRFCWLGFEIEVFEDRLEIYRFHDQHSDIWYEEHRAGDAFTSRFLTEMAKLASPENPTPK
ncbi:MAG: hypothetical protein WBQ94_09065 [Terracidiphilus sp.]